MAEAETRTGPSPVREAAVAGLFYPEDSETLRTTVRGHVEAVGPPDPPDEQSGLNIPPKAVIAPHAGYRYSGHTAGYAYDALAAHRGTVERVVVLGPAHRVPLEGIGLSSAREWRTPLGPVEVDREALHALENLPGVVESDEAHAPEHSIEVHLPFIQEVLGEVPVVPVVVGRTSTAVVARAVQALWGDQRTVIVASSDLSHYLDDTAARARDQETATAILEGRAHDIGPRDACGCLPVGGLLTAATAHGLAPRLLHLSTSADATGEATRVVGYGSFAFQPPLPLDQADQTWLLDLAERTIVDELKAGEPYPLTEVESVPLAARRPGACFVTLTRGDDLLGCIGSLEPQRPLWHDVVHNARAAAFADPRFPALAEGDLDGLDIEISVLSPLEELPAPSAAELVQQLRPGIDGAVVAAAGKRGTFLPDVWTKIPEPELFVRELARKARWDEAWMPGARAWRYTTNVFGSDSRPTS